MRAFLAIEIDNKIKDTVVKLIERLSSMGKGISWVKREQIHLTLFFFEDLKEEDVEKLSLSVDLIASKTLPFNLEIKGSGFFGKKENPRVFWLGIEKEVGALKKLQAEITETFKSFGYFEDKKFNPHLTIGRNKSGKSQKSVVSTLFDFKDFSLGTFFVKEITLFKSDLLKSGALHTPIKRYTLGGKFDTE